MPRAAPFPMSATASQAGGAVLAQWFDATRLLLRWPTRRTPDPSISQAARVLSEHAHAGRKAVEATIAAREAEMTAKLKAEHDSGWPIKVAPR